MSTRMSTWSGMELLFAFFVCAVGSLNVLLGAAYVITLCLDSRRGFQDLLYTKKLSTINICSAVRNAFA